MVAKQVQVKRQEESDEQPLWKSLRVAEPHADGGPVWPPAPTCGQGTPEAFASSQEGSWRSRDPLPCAQCGEARGLSPCGDIVLLGPALSSLAPPFKG